MTRTLRRPILVMSALLIAAMWLAEAAQATAPTFSPVPVPRPHSRICDDRDIFVAKLGEKYGETWRGGGLSGPVSLFEIWASEATGTWTILKTTPDGFTCVMAEGDNWRGAAGKLTPIGDPA